MTHAYVVALTSGIVFSLSFVYTNLRHHSYDVTHIVPWLQSPMTTAFRPSFRLSTELQFMIAKYCRYKSSAALSRTSKLLRSKYQPVLSRFASSRSLAFYILS
ncbi:hypothetical protein F4778DRAFT_110941 [Xylariomycetidae sp. FL2044]|nr:hypothetical protein F4778DRAFT_110941 [Xylariomycetidae sp. FL2044]